MANIEDLNLLRSAVELARDAQIKQTEEMILLIKDMPETPEIAKLKEKLRIADEKINKQLYFVLRVERIVKNTLNLNYGAN